MELYWWRYVGGGVLVKVEMMKWPRKIFEKTRKIFKKLEKKKKQIIKTFEKKTRKNYFSVVFKWPVILKSTYCHFKFCFQFFRFNFSLRNFFNVNSLFPVFSFI